MKKAKHSRQDPKSFHHSITHTEVSGRSVMLRLRSGELFELVRRVGVIRCHLLEVFHRKSLAFDPLLDVEPETLDCRICFTKTIIVGAGPHIRLATQDVSFVRTENPYWQPFNWVAAKHLEYTDEERNAHSWPDVIHKSRISSCPDEFSERDKEPLPAFCFPASSTSRGTALNSVTFDELRSAILAHQNNLELQAFVEVDGYFGDCGITALPAGGFQFIRIRKLVVGNLYPMKPIKTSPRLPGDYMFWL